jgi:uncharacterized protein YoaH (UPF0181 family)
MDTARDFFETRQHAVKMAQRFVGEGHSTAVPGELVEMVAAAIRHAPVLEPWAHESRFARSHRR